MNQIAEVEETIGGLPAAQTDTKHFFTTGLYTRQTFLPAGTLATGKRHRHRTLNILIEGTMKVLMDDDTSRHYEVTAPATFESEAGVRKAVYCVSDCILLNVHRSDETDLDKLEKDLIMPDDLAGVFTEQEET